ncbi:MAG: hypothetical protein IJ770_04400 [Alphaproteobacteria bacterium]|nr:hypothetical protein [Alphaproteobacteria bacterium]
MLKKLANGEYSLKITFWIFGVLGLFFFCLITNMTHNSVLRMICPRGIICGKSVILYTLSNIISVFLNGGYLLTGVGIHFLISTIFVVYAYILLRGLWKSSASYDGRAFWSVCAKFVLILLILVSLKSII